MTYRSSAAALAAAVVLSACAGLPPQPVPAWGADLVAVTQYNRVVSFNHGATGTLETSVPIQGLAAGETILAIDYRPDNHRLYALSSAATLYRLDWRTGTLSAPVQLKAAADGAFHALAGNVYDIDFSADGRQLVVVSDAGQHLSVEPDSGVVSVLPSFEAPNSVIAVAFTAQGGEAFSSAPYVLNAVGGLELDMLPGNGAKPVTVGSLGGSFGRFAGFDILDADGGSVAYAALSIPDSTQSKLYAIQLGAGTAKSYGTISGDAKIRSLAIRPDTAS